MSVFLQRGGVFRLGAVQLRPLQQHLQNAAFLRTVGILIGLHFGVVFAVYRHPFLSDHARC